MANVVYVDDKHLKCVIFIFYFGSVIHRWIRKDVSIFLLVNNKIANILLFLCVIESFLYSLFVADTMSEMEFYLRLYYK